MPHSRYSRWLPFGFIAAGILSFLTSLFLLQLFFGLLFLLWLLEKNTEKKKAFDTIGLLLLAFLITRLLSVVFSPFGESYQALYKDALFYVTFFTLSFYFKSFTKGEIERILLFIAASMAVVAVIGILRFNLGDVKRAESFGSGYATYSTYLLAGMGVLLSLYKRFFGEKKILFSLLLSLLLTGIITSLGRFNIALAVPIFIAGIFLFRIDYKAILLTIAVTGILSFISFSNNSTEAEQRISQAGQLSDRDILFQGALEIWDQRPVFGFGPRTFHKIFPFPGRFNDKFIGSWHNDFIQVYFESGILGLITFTFLLLFILYQGIKFNLTTKPENGYILYGILLAVTGLILSSLTAGFINSPVLSVFFSLLAALCSAFIYKDEQNLSLNGNKNGN